MYVGGMGGGVVAAAVTTTAVVTLPKTGGNVIVSLALSVAAGLIAWGVVYARNIASNKG